MENPHLEMDDLVENLHPAQNLHRTRGKRIEQQKNPAMMTPEGFCVFVWYFSMKPTEKENTCLFPNHPKGGKQKLEMYFGSR